MGVGRGSAAPHKPTMIVKGQSQITMIAACPEYLAKIKGPSIIGSQIMQNL